MSNININIDFSSFANAFGQLITRMGHLSQNDIVGIILSFLLPPLAVFFKVGVSTHFWINIILTALGWVPGVIHSLWVILFI